MPVPWSNSEVDLIIADYFSMLIEELSGITFNKAKHRNALRILLTSRSEGSVEFKHQNISAVLIKLGLPFIKGYLPRWNFQALLEEKIIAYLFEHKQNFESKFIEFADTNTLMDNPVNFNSILESPPARKFIVNDQQIIYDKRPFKINYLEREQKNSLLGTKGESLALEYEKWRLIQLGKANLANKIEWVSLADDSAGFDILSRNENGTDRYIEVKTTKLSKDTPIFFSKSEYDFSTVKRNDYHLYRVFNFNESPKLFNIAGSFDDFCTKQIMQFKGYF